MKRKYKTIFQIRGKDRTSTIEYKYGTCISEELAKDEIKKIKDKGKVYKNKFYRIEPIRMRVA